VPAVRDLRRRYAKEPAFMMISVSTDSDEAKWKEFATKNQMMTWPQYPDLSKHLLLFTNN
jgi:hypothetical protein